FKSGLVLVKNRMFIFSNPEKTGRMMKSAQVAMVIAKTAMDVMMFTPVIFLLPNKNGSIPEIIESTPVEIRLNDKTLNTNELFKSETPIRAAAERQTKAMTKAIANFIFLLILFNNLLKIK